MTIRLSTSRGSGSVSGRNAFACVKRLTTSADRWTCCASSHGSAAPHCKTKRIEKLAADNQQEAGSGHTFSNRSTPFEVEKKSETNRKYRRIKNGDQCLGRSCDGRLSSPRLSLCGPNFIQLCLDLIRRQSINRTSITTTSRKELFSRPRVRRIKLYRH